MANTLGIHGTRILIIDDCCDTASTLCALFLMNGYKNAFWTTDKGAVACLGPAHEYDLILLDMLMPTISGIDLLHRLHFTQPESCVPVIAMSGDQRYRTVAIQAGARAFLLKPFSQDELQATISDVLFTHHGCCGKPDIDVAISRRL